MRAPNILKILSLGLAVAAAYFLLMKNDAERSFIIATLGAIAFFLSIRFEIVQRQRLKNKESENPASGEKQL
jgi:hypothetical protein